MEKEKSAIQTRNLAIGYKLKGGKKVIHARLDLTLTKGEVTCLLGLNGAGKSTLIRTLCGFQPSLEGEVAFNGRPLQDFTQSEFAREVGVVLTERTNAGGITVYELVSLGRHPYTGFFGQLKEEDHRIIHRALEAAGIAHKSRSYVSELSDGERQKAMIAKVLAQECPTIILDEPTAFLDITSRIETMVLLQQLAKKQGKAILLSTHDIDAAIQMGDRLWLLSKEKDFRSGAPEDLIMDGSIGEFFSKENVVFDKATGKLNAARANSAPIGVDGDPYTAWWVGNALVRNGFDPVQPVAEKPSVHCVSPNEIWLRLPDGTQKKATSVALLCNLMKNL